jgi:hypothetical protein
MSGSAEPGTKLLLRNFGVGGALLATPAGVSQETRPVGYSLIGSANPRVSFVEIGLVPIQKGQIFLSNRSGSMPGAASNSPPEGRALWRKFLSPIGHAAGRKAPAKLPLGS